MDPEEWLTSCQFQTWLTKVVKIAEKKFEDGMQSLEILEPEVSRLDFNKEGPLMSSTCDAAGSMWCKGWLATTRTHGCGARNATGIG